MITSVYNVRVGKLIDTKTQVKGVRYISKLATLRKAKGLSQDRLSKLSGISRVTISRIEAGKDSPTIRTLERLALGLEVPLAELIEKAG